MTVCRRLFVLLVWLIIALGLCTCNPPLENQSSEALPSPPATFTPLVIKPQPTMVVIEIIPSVSPTPSNLFRPAAPSAAGWPQEGSAEENDFRPPDSGEEPQPLPLPPTSAPLERPIFDQFVERVKNGNPDQVVGVYVEDVLGLRVVQQPPNDPAFVSNINGTATQFLLAFQIAGNIGLLAHNYLSGGLFFYLQPGDVVEIIYGDGSVWEYEVQQIYEYQALDPDSPRSTFVDLATGETLTAGELFDRIYAGAHHVAFQTCIAQGVLDTWGRLFVLAPPYD